jgi:hypothetical protein
MSQSLPGLQSASLLAVVAVELQVPQQGLVAPVFRETLTQLLLHPLEVAQIKGTREQLQVQG